MRPSCNCLFFSFLLSLAGGGPHLRNHQTEAPCLLFLSFRRTGASLLGYTFLRFKIIYLKFGVEFSIIGASPAEGAGFVYLAWKN